MKDTQHRLENLGNQSRSLLPDFDNVSMNGNVEIPVSNPSIAENPKPSIKIDTKDIQDEITY